MKKRMVILFFSLVYSFSPLLALAAEEVSQEVASPNIEAAITETIDTEDAPVATIEAPEEEVSEESEEQIENANDQSEPVSAPQDIVEADSAESETGEIEADDAAEVEVVSTEEIDSTDEIGVPDQNSDPVESSSLQALTSVEVERTVIRAECECRVNGLYGSYYNLPENHPNIGGVITGVVPGTVPSQFDWFSDQYLRFERTDAISTFNQTLNFFPVPTEISGDPFYFAIHWQGSVIAPETKSYKLDIGSDDDSWVFINGVQKTDLGGIHSFAATSTMVDLVAGTSTIDIYFAERHVVQSGIKFSIDGGVTFSPCREEPAPENLPPYFVNFNPQTVATSTEAYTYDVEAEDPENDVLAFSLLSAPAGMNIATSTGMISWTPSDEQATTTPYEVVVQVSDGPHATSTGYEITVAKKRVPHENHLPVFSGPTTASTKVENGFSFDLTVSDEDNDPITLTFTIPNGATFASSTFHWTPTTTGSFIAEFFAFDGTGTSTHHVDISVTPNDSGGSGGGGGGSNPPPSNSGGGGGGGGGVGANGPPIPLVFPVIPASFPPPATPIVPLQPIPDISPAPTSPPQIAGDAIVVPPPSVSTSTPTTTPVESIPPAGGKSFAGLLVAGLFNFLNWVRDHWCLLGWLLFLITLIILLIVLFSRDGENDTSGSQAPLVPEKREPEGLLKQTPQASTINEYWETYLPSADTQEKE